MEGPFLPWSVLCKHPVNVSLALERALELYTGIGLPLPGLLASGDYLLERVEAAQMGLVVSFQES